MNSFHVIKKRTGLLLSTLTMSTLLLTLPSCDDSFETKGVAAFSEPQPGNEKPLASFPINIRGTFLSLSDSNTIVIGAESIHRINDDWSVINKNELDSSVIFSNDTLYDKQSGQGFPAIQNGDSIKIHFYSDETVFAIDNAHVLKQFKGNFFLSTKATGDSTWGVQKLSLSKDKLTLSLIATLEDLNKLGAATETAIDTTKVQSFKPSKRAFKKFVKKEGFSELEVFQKIK